MDKKLKAFYEKWVGKLPSCNEKILGECSKCYKRDESFKQFKKEIQLLSN